MTYEIKYRCRYNKNSGSLFSPPFPTLKIKHRWIGAFRWRTLDKRADYYAAKFYQDENEDYQQIFYDPDMFSVNVRLSILMDILDNKYHGNMEEYVVDIVKRVLSEQFSQDETNRDTDSMIQAIVTHGWKKTTLQT